MGKKPKAHHKGNARGGRGGSGRRKRGSRPLDSNEVCRFAATLREHHFSLVHVSRDGNCFFRSLSDQLSGSETGHLGLRQRICQYMQEHEDDFAPFLTFGEGDEEDDEDYAAYIERMRRDGEWAGQPELLAAAHALQVHIYVHQLGAPTYRIDCPDASARSIHLSYHDGEHYNSVHPKDAADAADKPPAAACGAGAGGGGSGVTTDEKVVMASCVGCSHRSARAALAECDGDVGLAIEWLQQLSVAGDADGAFDDADEEGQACGCETGVADRSPASEARATGAAEAAVEAVAVEAEDMAAEAATEAEADAATDSPADAAAGVKPEDGAVSTGAADDSAPSASEKPLPRAGGTAAEAARRRAKKKEAKAARALARRREAAAASLAAANKGSVGDGGDDDKERGVIKL